MKQEQIKIYAASSESHHDIPLYEDRIQAGFPSPAEDFLRASIDLNKEFIKNPSATFFGRVMGDSMKDVGISDGDLLIIDKSLEPTDGKIAVCFLDGEFTVKQIELRGDECFLLPANAQFKPIKVTADNDFIVWGIVVHVIKSF
ncbi:MAG: translesion error-prone DNA polymerase V autoproteolytic subunit [Bacteroidales bacterium]|jgi:DNA polymerase V|nr:translesion error-prone DNA polymerase V autoproteolytic subunit [Bacteroidales bacterium]